MGRESGWCPHCCLIRSKHCRDPFEAMTCDERKAYVAEREKLRKELKQIGTGPIILDALGLVRKTVTVNKR